MATRTKPKAVAVSSKAAKNLDLLGHVAMFTLPEEPVKGTKLVRAWNAAGLDLDVIPRQRSGADIFRSACRSVESKRGTNGHTGIEIKVDEVPLRGGTEVLYQITRVNRDGELRQVDHPKGMVLRYDVATEDITVETEFEEYAPLRSLEDDVRKHFAKNAKTSSKVRNAIREVLYNLGSTGLRGKAGGVYFVPIKDAKGNDTLPVLRGLQKVLADLWGDRADLYLIPLISDDEANDMVAKHFAMSIAEQTREVTELALQRVRLGKARAPRKDLLANLHNKRRQLAGAIKQYEALVSLETDSISDNMEALDSAIEKLHELSESGDE